MKLYKIHRMKLYKIKQYTPYICGVVGADIRLTLWERLRILFCKGIQVNFISESMKKGFRQL